MEDIYKLDMIKDKMKLIKINKLKNGNYCTYSNKGLYTNKQGAYKILYDIQEILNGFEDVE